MWFCKFSLLLVLSTFVSLFSMLKSVFPFLFDRDKVKTLETLATSNLLDVIFIS